MQLPRAGEWKRVGGLPARSCQPTRPARRSAAQVGALVAKESKIGASHHKARAWRTPHIDYNTRSPPRYTCSALASRMSSSGHVYGSIISRSSNRKSANPPGAIRPSWLSSNAA